MKKWNRNKSLREHYQYHTKLQFSLNLVRWGHTKRWPRHAEVHRHVLGPPASPHSCVLLPTPWNNFFRGHVHLISSIIYQLGPGSARWPCRTCLPSADARSRAGLMTSTCGLWSWPRASWTAVLVQTCVRSTGLGRTDLWSPSSSHRSSMSHRG